MRKALLRSWFLAAWIVASLQLLVLALMSVLGSTSGLFDKLMTIFLFPAGFPLWSFVNDPHGQGIALVFLGSVVLNWGFYTTLLFLLMKAFRRIRSRPSVGP